jgi:E3 ubiquitin-protein ligase listerin
VRKWLLGISTVLRNENGSIAGALLLWRRNVRREFQGLEPCLVCYSIVHPSNSSLPRMNCRTCKQKFHPQVRGKAKEKKKEKKLYV